MARISSFIISLSLLIQVVPLVTRAALYEDLQQKRQELQQEVQEKRDTLKTEVQEKRDALRGSLSQSREEMRQKMEVFRNEVMEKREALQEELKNRREQFKTEAQKRRDELKKKLGEKRAERIEAFFQRMVEKFEHAIERLKKHADKIAEHLDKAEANGKEVAAFREKLASANDKILAAESALEDAKAKYTEAAEGQDFKASFAKVREIVHGVAEKVKEAHRALVDVVNSIKGLGRGTGDEREDIKKVEITSAGFAPSTLEIKASTTVQFINRDSAPHWPASGVHPTHEICPGFDSLKGLATGESYSVTFKEVKTCPMHDHLNPSITGSIIVE